MPDKHILVVEDEAAIRDMIGFNMERFGFSWTGVSRVAEAQHAIAERRPDLILLDWMLPDISGLDFARRLRREDATREIPIILLTARGEEDDKIKGFEAGADDYIAKPFSPRELNVRIKAVLRRMAPGGEESVIEVDGLRLDVGTHRVMSGADIINLGPTEFRLLHFLMTHPERVYSRTQLLDRVWGSNVYIEDRTVDVHIRRLRKALSERGCDRLIQTVRGSGYRFSTHE
jgi:two-component system phosphate regulon response regulator PhoB